MNQDETITEGQLFLKFAREILRRMQVWSSTGELPKKRIRRYVGNHVGRVQEEPDYRQLIENHFGEIVDDPLVEQCTRQLLAKGVIRLLPTCDSTTGQPITDFKRLRPMATHQLLEPILDLVEREGFEVSDVDILSSYDHLAQPTWLTFVPLINFTTDAPVTNIGQLFEIGPFTPVEKTALWDEHFQMQGDFITLTQYERATSRLIGRAIVGRDQPDFIEELRRVITALRLLKPGRVGAPALFSKSSMFTTFGGWISSLDNYAVHPSSIHGRFPEYTLLNSELPRVLGLYDQICKAEQTKQLKSLAVAIRRFNQAYARATGEDRIIDFCIALESSLLSDVREELVYRLSLRGAALLAETRNPEVTKWVLRKIYEARSAIVHKGKSLQQLEAKTRARAFVPLAPSLDEICEDIVRAILCSYIGRLAGGESLKQVNEELERRLLPASRRSVGAARK